MPHDATPTLPTDAIATAVRGFQRGGVDRDKHFTYLVECYFPVLRRYFGSRVAHEDALDLTQKTFSRVYEKLKDLREPEKFGGWLLAIARNILNRFHLQCRQEALVIVAPPASTDGSPGDPLERQADQSPDGLDQLLKHEAQALLRTAIDELPPKMRCCVELRVYQNMDYKDIAAAVGISVQTVKAHLFQAKERLRKALGPPLPGRR